jgi:serpin B
MFGDLADHRARLVVFVSCVLSLGAGAAASEKESGMPETGKTMSPDVRAVTHSSNEFALALYGRLRSRQSGNLFFSPTSIWSALAMTSAGAEGETRQQMAEVLHFSLPGERVHAAFADLKRTWSDPQQRDYELLMANRLWGQEGYDFLADYLSTTREQYGAELARVDFAGQAEQVRKQINTWVQQQTQDRITNLIAPGTLNRLTRLVLTNAIYFQGKWQHKFDEEATQDAPFHVTPGETATVPMMFQKERFRYAASDGLQIVELPYVGQDLSMLVLLPEQGDGLAQLEQRLTMERLEQWLSQLRSRELKVYLPRFTITDQFQLASTLVAMGMSAAFSPQQADFSGISANKELYISDAIHKAFVQVNEEGTEAAAATGVVVGVTSLPPPPVEFRADHPFLFLIRDNRTRSILMVGRLSEPSQ